MYEPFPAPRVEEHSVDFVRGLKADHERLQGLTGEDLDHGVLLASAGRGPRASLASERGEPASGFAPSMGWLAGALVLVAVAGGGALAVSRRT